MLIRCVKDKASSRCSFKPDELTHIFRKVLASPTYSIWCRRPSLPAVFTPFSPATYTNIRAALVARFDAAFNNNLTGGGTAQSQSNSLVITLSSPGRYVQATSSLGTLNVFQRIELIPAQLQPQISPATIFHRVKTLPYNVQVTVLISYKL